MKENEIVSDVNFTSVDSLLNERKYYKVLSVAKGIESFVHDNFGGLAEVDVDVSEDILLFVSIESLAAFLKEVFNFVHGRSLVKMHFHSADERFLMSLSLSSTFECSFNEMSHLIYFARDIGFDIIHVEENVLFSLNCYRTKSFRVYAPLIADDVKEIVDKLKTAFYIQWKLSE